MLNRKRKPFSTSLETELIEELKKLSDQTLIPQSKLVSKALKDLLEKHNQTKSGE